MTPLSTSRCSEKVPSYSAILVLVILVLNLRASRWLPSAQDIVVSYLSKTGYDMCIPGTRSPIHEIYTMVVRKVDFAHDS
jgi:hypothetical protein